MKDDFLHNYVRQCINIYIGTNPKNEPIFGKKPKFKKINGKYYALYDTKPLP